MIHLARPYIDDDDVRAVVETLKSGNLSLGPKVQEFEQAFARYIGTTHAIAVANGTCGLHLCVNAIGLKPGDEVITTPFSFVASSNCILYGQGKPVFADIDKDTFNIDPARIEEKITKRTKAILPVHIFGLPADMKPIMEIAEKHNLKIIEDAAEAIGAEYNGKNVGTFGVASVFAFYPNKQMTTGEGGMVCTNDDAVARICRSLRNQGRGENDEWLSHNYIGYNYRLSDIACALGLSQLKKIDFLLSEREKVAQEYTKKLRGVPRVKTPFVSKRSWFVYVVQLDKNVDRALVINKLKDSGIQTRPYLPAIHLQPAYRKMGFTEGMYPVCEAVSRSTLALPFYTGMTMDDIKMVCDTLKEVLSSL